MSLNPIDRPFSAADQRGADLLRAKQQLDESERLIERQKQMVARLHKEGRPTERALQVLSMLESGHLQMRNFLEVLKARKWREDQ